ncbi:MAG: type II toxin-antitoxin system VapC family toxin, partial [Desulfobacterales bacterium]|nr:type II toxin-antitoxin system VapC family toxin [Desulfobacterales bacterium]
MTAKKYILDTNIITYLHEQSSPFHNKVKNNLSSLCDDDKVYVSVFSLYEIEYGIPVFRLKLSLVAFLQTRENEVGVKPVVIDLCPLPRPATNELSCRIGS